MLCWQLSAFSALQGTHTIDQGWVNMQEPPGWCSLYIMIVSISWDLSAIRWSHYTSFSTYFPTHPCDHFIPYAFFSNIPLLLSHIDSADDCDSWQLKKELSSTPTSICTHQPSSLLICSKLPLQIETLLSIGETFTGTLSLSSPMHAREEVDQPPLSSFWYQNFSFYWTIQIIS